MHFIVGFLIVVLISYITMKRIGRYQKSIITGLLVSLFFGILKEIIDPIIGGNQDWLDILYTIAGGLLGSAIMILINRVFIK